MKVLNRRKVRDCPEDFVVAVVVVFVVVVALLGMRLLTCGKRCSNSVWKSNQSSHLLMLLLLLWLLLLWGGGGKCFYLPVASDGRLMKPSRTMEKIAHEGMIRQTNKETETKNHR